MTKEQVLALQREAGELTRALADLPKATESTVDPETVFKRRVDAVWGNIATEKPWVTREEVERRLREFMRASY